MVRLGREKGPSGSVFLQLFREMVLCTMMGGMPSLGKTVTTIWAVPCLLEILTQGTASEGGMEEQGWLGSWGALSREISGGVLNVGQQKHADRMLTS